MCDKHMMYLQKHFQNIYLRKFMILKLVNLKADLI